MQIKKRNRRTHRKTHRKTYRKTYRTRKAYRRRRNCLRAGNEVAPNQYINDEKPAPNPYTNQNVRRVRGSDVAPNPYTNENGPRVLYVGLDNTDEAARLTHTPHE